MSDEANRGRGWRTGTRIARRMAATKTLLGLLVGVATVLVVAQVALAAFVSTGQTEAGPEPSAAAGEIPAIAMEAYQRAAKRCEGVSWPILAGIGQVESHHGSLYGGEFDDTGLLVPPLYGIQLSGSGQGENYTPFPIGQWLGHWGLQGPYQQAMGPMQFMPGTWSGLGVDANSDGTAHPQNIFDAAASAAELLCQREGGVVTDLAAAIKTYNNSDRYVAEVLQQAALYAEHGISDGGSSDAGELVAHPNMCLADRARQDLEDNIVDPRLVQALSAAVNEFRICVGWFRTGHRPCVSGTGAYPDCKLSHHWFGRAADITTVDGEPVHPGNQNARRLADWWWSENFTGRSPDSLGSPWPEAFGFTDAAHQNHLHVAFFADRGAPTAAKPPLPPTATPVPAPKLLIADLYGPAGALRTTPAATTASNVLSETIEASGFTTSRWDGVVPAQTTGSGPHHQTPVTDTTVTTSPPSDTPSPKESGGGVARRVGPREVQAAIDGRISGEVIGLLAAEYGPIVIAGDLPVTLVGPERGTARFTNPDGAAMVVHRAPVTVTGVQIGDSERGIEAVGAAVTLDDVVIDSVRTDAVNVSGGSLTMSASMVEGSGSGVVAASSSVLVSGSKFTTISGHPVWTTGQTTLQAFDNVFVGSSYAAISASGSAEVKRNFIGDVHAGAALITTGTADIAGNVVWANDGLAVVAAGSGSVVNNALVDGTVVGSESVVVRSNLSGLAARTVVGSPWMDRTTPTPAAVAAVAVLAP